MSEDNFITKIKLFIKSFDFRFLVFLLISTVLWLSLQFSKTNIQTYSIGVNYIVPDTKLLAQEPERKIIVKLKSKTWNLLNTNKFNDDIDIRLTKQNNQIVSEATLYNLLKEHIDTKYDIISLIPSSISVQLVNPSMKKVPVVLKGAIQPKSGYSVINGLSIIPDSITVYGKDDDIVDIESWYTEKAIESGISSDIDKLMNLEPNKMTNSISISPRQVRVQATIDRLAEKSFKKKIITTASDSMYSIPVYALVKLAVPLRNIDKIDAKDIYLSLDGFKYGDSISSYKLKVNHLPASSKLLQISPEQVTVYRSVGGK